MLFVPASNPRALENARSLACDTVVLDLEDSVAPEMKAAARAAAVQAVAAEFGGREVVVRCNGLDTEWGADDLAALAEAGPDAVLAPKVSREEDIVAHDRGPRRRAGLHAPVGHDRDRAGRAEPEGHRRARRWPRASPPSCSAPTT